MVMVAFCGIIQDARRNDGRGSDFMVWGKIAMPIGMHVTISFGVSNNQTFEHDEEAVLRMDAYLVGLAGVVFLIILLVLGTHIGVPWPFPVLTACTIDCPQNAMAMCVSFCMARSPYGLGELPLFILVGFLASGGASVETSIKA
jgi:hypothetical protein